MTDHTPTPWHYWPHFDNGVITEDSMGVHIVRMTGVNTLANAEFIVRAVNCHDELVKALEAVVRDWDSPDVSPERIRDQAIAALAKAKGGKP